MSSVASNDRVPSVEDVLSRVAMWSGLDIAHHRMIGGLSHQIWRVDAGARSYVLRVLDPAVSEVGLGVPPSQEIVNTLRAAESGAGPAVCEVLADVPALVLEYLPGPTLNAADVRGPGQLPRIAAACHLLHGGPRFGNDFSIVAKLYELLALCDRYGLPIPDSYRARLSIVEEVSRALAITTVPTVPCHNDLLAENFIDSGGEIRIVDYQLSGNNDPCFELGDIAAEADLDPDATGALAAAYFGAELTPALLARVRLNLFLSNSAWTLWFAVHHGLLTPGATDFDYAAEAGDKWRRAQRDADASDFARLLDVVAGRRHSGTASAHP